MILETLIAASIVTAAAQSTTPVVKGPLDSVLWDYDFTKPENASVDRFYVNIDSAAASTALLVKEAASPTPGTYQYKLPALVPGTHTISVLACNVDSLCSEPASLMFRLIITPGAPQNIRLGSGRLQ